MENIIINKSKETDWYFELDGKIVPFVKETEDKFFIDVRGEMLSIPKTDASKLEEMEIDLDDETYAELVKYADEHGMTIDELVNKILREELNKNDNQPVEGNK